MKLPDPESKALPFQEALDYHRNKVRLPTRAWNDLWEGEHARAFMVAGAYRDDLLAAFQQALDKAIAEGTSLETFRRDFDKIVARHGWSYNGKRGWRSAVIYDTNLRQAHMAGRWQQIQRNKQSRPYLRYIALQEGNRRPQHQRLHGLIRPLDDPIWKTIMPMNGWGCKCTVQSLSEADLKRRGWKVSPTSPDLTYVEHEIKTAHGPLLVETPEGIDPGFGYNVGEAAWGNWISAQALAAFRKTQQREWTRLTGGDWQSFGRPQSLPLDKPKAKALEPVADAEALEAALIRALGGKEKSFALPDGTSVFISAEALAAHIPPDRGSFLAYLPEILEDPYEIWLSFERHEPTGKIALRKRLIKVLDFDGKDTSFAVAANVTKGLFEGWTFIPMRNAKGLIKQRAGRLTYGRPEKGPE